MALEVGKVLKHGEGGVLRQDGEVTTTEQRAARRDRGEEEEEREQDGTQGSAVVKCLGQIILGRQSIFPGIQTHLHANNHTTSAHPS